MIDGQIAALFEPASPVLEELLDSLIFVARADGAVFRTIPHRIPPGFHGNWMPA